MKFLNRFKISLPPLPTAPPSHALGQAILLQLSAVILVAVVTHFSIANLLVASFALLLWGLKTTQILRYKANPPRWLITLLTVVSLLMILLLYGGWNGQKAGISFLVLLIGLKFLESNTLRDYYVVCLILLFLASCSFLFESSPAQIILVMAYVVAIVAILLKISSPTPLRLRKSLILAATIIAKAAPLAILLFFFFPRIQGSFGFLPSQDDNSSDQQLNNSLVAGDFATGAFNQALAFRVEFDGDIPPNHKLYWRAKVMSREQGFHWEVTMPGPEELNRAKLRKSIPPSATNTSPSNDQGVSYQIVHERSSDRFVPFLDYVQNQSIGWQLDNHSVVLAAPTDGIFFYQGVSSQQPVVKQPSGLDRAKYLTTMSTPTARSLALLSQWRREAPNDRELVNTVYQHFVQNNFRYSLTPPGLGDKPLDQFLFETQSGYCEHYASAFTILMRWLGIPSRVVVGYQGGSPNRVGGYLEVRYSDAHAWSEVFLQGQWQRVDPTAAISPDRIDFGMDALMLLWENNMMGPDGGTALADFLNPGGMQKVYQQMRQNWENIGYQWNKWVVNYDFESQTKLLQSLGLQHRNSLSTLVSIVIGGTLFLLLLYFWQLIPRPAKIGEAQRIYHRFIVKFRRFKVTRDLSDSPSEFAQKAIALAPHQALEIQQITAIYLQLIYGLNGKSEEHSETSNNLLESFKKSVKQFKLKPVKSV